MKIKYINYHKIMPNCKVSFERWISFTRYGGWELFEFGILHHQINIDLRRGCFMGLDSLDDMKDQNKTLKSELRWMAGLVIILFAYIVSDKLGL